MIARLISVLLAVAAMGGCTSAARSSAGSDLFDHDCGGGALSADRVALDGRLIYRNYPGGIVALKLVPLDYDPTKTLGDAGIFLLSDDLGWEKKEQREGQVARVYGQPRCVRTPDALQPQLALEVTQIKLNGERSDVRRDIDATPLFEIRGGQTVEAQMGVLASTLADRHGDPLAAFSGRAERNEFSLRRAEWVLDESPGAVRKRISIALPSTLRFFKGAEDDVFYACRIEGIANPLTVSRAEELADVGNERQDFCLSLQGENTRLVLDAIAYGLSYEPRFFSPTR